MSEPPIGDDWFPLAEITTRVAALAWVEAALSDVLATWSVIEPHPRARLAFHVAGRHHAWHAQILQDNLATSEQLREHAELHAPHPGWVDAIAASADAVDPDRTVARLLLIVREFDPWLARETGALLNVANPLSDGALLRWLRFIELDHRIDGEGPAAVLDSLRANTVSLEDRALLATIDVARNPQR